MTRSDRSNRIDIEALKKKHKATAQKFSQIAAAAQASAAAIVAANAAAQMQRTYLTSFKKLKNKITHNFGKAEIWIQLFDELLRSLNREEYNPSDELVTLIGEVRQFIVLFQKKTTLDEHEPEVDEELNTFLNR